MGSTARFPSTDAEVPTPLAVVADAVEPVVVGKGCLRRNLPAPPGARAWLVEMAPGGEWPDFDRHDTGESYLVLSGEVSEGDRRYPAGTHVLLPPGTRHRPRSVGGARLFGFHLAPEAFLGAGGDPAALFGQLHVMQG